MISPSRFITLRSACVCLLLALNACAWNTAPPTVNAKPASLSDQLSIGPYSRFSGRLIVFSPAQRWQVSIDWQAAQPQTGKLRLSHALSGTIVDFRWSGSSMEVRDNKAPYWRPIQQQELNKQGIILPPSQLASVLLNQTPAHFHRIKHDTWESMDSGDAIQLRWQEKLHTLTIIDVQQHRTAKLIIKSHADLTRSR